MVFHCLNRGNDRRVLFDDAGDYAAFERAMESVVRAIPMRLTRRHRAAFRGDPRSGGPSARSPSPFAPTQFAGSVHRTGPRVSELSWPRSIIRNVPLSSPDLAVARGSRAVAVVVASGRRATRG